MEPINIQEVLPEIYTKIGQLVVENAALYKQLEKTQARLKELEENIIEIKRSESK